MTERITILVRGETPQEAQTAAREWAKSEPHHRLRTIATVRKQLAPDGVWAGAWLVDVVLAPR